MRTVGFVVNPVAGMGGRVGLKGTDGKVAEARERGAEPRAPARGRAAATALHERAPESRLVTAGEPMGAAEAHAAGFEPEVAYDPPAETTAADTRAAVRAFVDRNVDLVMFVGGDGTAVDVVEALDDAGAGAASDGSIPILGVPAGVKVYSAVFAVSPASAGRIAATFDRTAEREVNDVDEAAYRDGEVRATLRGVARVPVADDLQASKQTVGGSVEGLAAGVADDVEPGVTYLLGPGGTLQTIKRALGFEGSPLGVDGWRDGEVVVRDGGERELLAALGDRNVAVVSPIGGQGFVFGRGNDQLSPRVLRRCGVEIVASREKLAETGVLRVDTGDPELDEELRGWRRVRVGRYERVLVEIV